MELITHLEVFCEWVILPVRGPYALLHDQFGLDGRGAALGQTPALPLAVLGCGTVPRIVVGQVNHHLRIRTLQGLENKKQNNIGLFVSFLPIVKRLIPHFSQPSENPSKMWIL